MSDVVLRPLDDGSGGYLVKTTRGLVLGTVREATELPGVWKFQPGLEAALLGGYEEIVAASPQAAADGARQRALAGGT